MEEVINTPIDYTIAKVWLVVPVFNAAPYLQECLDSISNQSFTDFHTLIIDDGSTDGSIEIIKSHCSRDKRFELIKIPHKGVSYARNVGIDKSKGKYIGFVDADDCLYPYSLEILVENLESTNSQVCIGKHNISTDYKPIKKRAAKPIIMDYATAMQNALYQRYILNAPWGMLMERRLLGTDIRFSEGIRYEDLDAFYRFYEKADSIAYVSTAVYFYRRVKSSFIHCWSPSRLDALEVTDRIVEYMSIHHPQLTDAALDRQFSAYYNTCLVLMHYGIKDEKAIKRCIEKIKEGRRKAILDSKVRIKNKIGAVLSMCGTPLLRLISKFYF